MTIGRGSYIQRNVEISGNVYIGEDTVIGSYSFLSTMPDGNLRIGNDVLINSFSVIGGSESVDIGDHCIFAAYAHITDASHSFDDPDIMIKHARFLAKPVKINKNVWLGSSVMIMKGVTIGDGCVIGAKSLVNHDIPPNSIAVGIPAKIVRKRGERKKGLYNYENK